MHLRESRAPSAPAAPRVGVTLIELVVTLTLLALLGAVVIPVVQAPPPTPEEAAGSLEPLRRAAIREARARTARDRDGNPLVIGPLGDCLPLAPASDDRGTIEGWDPIRCRAVPLSPVVGSDRP